MNKKELIIFSIVILSLLILPNFVHAQAAQPTSPFRLIWNLVEQNFGWIIGIEKNPDQLAIFMKVCIFILITTILWYPVKLLTKRNGITAGITMPLSLMTTIFIPLDILETTFRLYGTFVVIALFAIPITAMYFLYKWIENNISERNALVGLMLQLTAAGIGLFTTFNLQDFLDKQKASGVANALIENSFTPFVMLGFVGLGIYAFVIYRRHTKGGGYKKGGLFGKKVPGAAPGAALETALQQEQGQIIGEQVKGGESIEKVRASMAAIPGTLQKEMQDEANLINFLNGILPVLNDLANLGNITSPEAMEKVNEYIEKIKVEHLGKVTATLNEIKKNCDYGVSTAMGSFGELEKTGKSLDNEIATISSTAKGLQESIPKLDEQIKNLELSIERINTPELKAGLETQLKPLIQQRTEFSEKLQTHEKAFLVATNMKNIFKGFETTLGNISNLTSELKKKTEGELQDIQKTLELISQQKYADSYNSLKGVVTKIGERRGDILKAYALGNDFNQKIANFKNEHDALKSLTAQLSAKGA